MPLQSILTLEDLRALPGKVVVDCSASWCGPCKRIAPEVEKMSEEYNGITMVTVDINDSEEISKTYDISSVPTFLFFVDGEQIESLRFVGSDLKKLRSNVENLEKFSK